MYFFKTLLVFILFNSSLYSTIHVFGECHSRNFNGFPDTKVHAIISVTMNKLAVKNKDLINLKKYNIRPKDIILFSFGEVDIRVHVKRIAHLKKISVEEIMDDLAHRYMKGIEKVIKGIPIKRENVIVVEILPPTTFRDAKIVDLEGNPILGKRDTIGSLKERASYNRYLNKVLKKKSKSFGFRFLSYVDKVRREDGALDPKYDDHDHRLDPKFHYIAHDALKKLLKQ